jgi:hypothetical protein
VRELWLLVEMFCIAAAIVGCIVVIARARENDIGGLVDDKTYDWRQMAKHRQRFENRER